MRCARRTSPPTSGIAGRCPELGLSQPVQNPSNVHSGTSACRTELCSYTRTINSPETVDKEHLWRPPIRISRRPDHWSRQSSGSGRYCPAEVTAETLQKLGIAPKNESYVINILKFLGLIDENGKKVDAKTQAFLQHDDAKFAQQFAIVVKDAYKALFDLYGDDAWSQKKDDLVTYFRTSDGSSDVVGKRQAITFNALGAMSGHGDAFVPRATSTNGKPANSSKAKPKAASSSASGTKGAPTVALPEPSANKVGLTVRIEVNLPANGDQKTYDAIFQSIRKNLIDSE